MTANFITCLRVVFSLIMLYFPVFSSGFYAFYLLAGITDMIDGTIARKLGMESKFGEKLDTIADLFFVAAALYKVLPVVEISIAIWIWIGVIAAIKIINIISGFVVQKQFVTVHSWANKITGFVLFALPFSLSVIDIKYSAIVVCILASLAAIWEGHLIRSRIRE